MTSFKEIFSKLCQENELEKDFLKICDTSDLENGILCLTSLSLDNKSIRNLKEALKESDDIFELDLSQSYLDNEDLSEVIKCVEHCHFIKSLKLNELPLNLDNILNLSKILIHNNYLQRLSLKWCKIGENTEACNALFTSIGQNDTLEHLDLSNNGLMSSLGKSLAFCLLKSNISLRTLNLSWNKLGDQAGEAILETLKINKNIQEIELQGNDLSHCLEISINSQLNHNVQLHLKHSEMLAKTKTLNNELNWTQDKFSSQIKGLQKEYQDLEFKGIQEQENLIFEIARLGEQLNLRNSEYGALIEKLELTSRALQVAEEKIENLENQDKLRTQHFKELQGQCAQYEREQRKDWIQREAEMKEIVERLTNESHEAKLSGNKSEENLKREISRREEVEFKLRNLELEKEELILSHEKLMKETKSLHEKQVKEFEEKLKDVKEDHLKELKDVFEARTRLVEEEKKEKEYLREKVEEFRKRIEEMREENGKEIKELIDKNNAQVDDLKNEFEVKLTNLNERLKFKEENNEKLMAENKNEKKVKSEALIELERKKLEIEEFKLKIQEFESDKEDLKNLIRIEFETKLKDFDEISLKLNETLEKNEKLGKEFQEFLDKTKEEKSKLEQIIEDLQKKIDEEMKKSQTLRMEEQKRAQGLLEAVKLFVSPDQN